MPIILLALTVHEFCHAYTALRMGDPTAYRMGRCSLNPLRHLDPLGTICLMFAPIGWAKPVPVNPLNFRNYRMGDLIVGAAGPLSNLAQAILFALLIRVMFMFKGRLPDSDQARQMFAIAVLMFRFAVTVNVGLAVFNCLPLFPLDGFHIAMQLTRSEFQQRFAETARMGPFLIMGIILVENFTQVDLLGRLINPPVRFFLHYVAGWPQFLS